MKSYEKPIIIDIELSVDDIIQTSAGNGLVAGEGSNDNGMNWSLRSQSDATGNIFQK